mmetsp:Transcript_18943/g.24370  ORF Transcript_18943/g.24370 Transcript_18943/m.24370 type:complete len:197 (+) Transcript_18943:124-714(+)
MMNKIISAVLLLPLACSAFSPNGAKPAFSRGRIIVESTYSTRWTMDDPEPEIDPRRKDPDDKPPTNPVRMPMIDTDGGQMDVISRLLKDRILLLGQGVDDEVANVLVAQLLYLANEDPEKEITLYINSPGGSVSAGMAIYDTMQYVPCDVATVCFGMAASMGAFFVGSWCQGQTSGLTQQSYHDPSASRWCPGASC